MQVAVYHCTVPNAKNQEKIDLLRYFGQGVTAVGDQAVDVHNHSVHNTPVAVIQGWVTETVSSKGHTQLRNNVIRQQLRLKKHVVAVDSNLFLYANNSNPGHYLRYSFNGVFPNTGIYCDTKIDPVRWQKISADLSIDLRPWRTDGDHILLCLQRNGGWSMGSVNVVAWANQTIAHLRQHTQRPIRIRCHPGDKGAKDYVNQIVGTGVSISTASDLIDDLQNCWAAVNHNSSPVVGAAIEGIPIFVTDVTRSQCQDIANTDLSQIETPRMPDRLPWVQRLSMFHWNFDELRSGECWRHMRQWALTN
jgi:hypothetical protein